MAMRSSTRATSLLSRALLLPRATSSSSPTPRALLEPSAAHRITRVESRNAASDTGTGTGTGMTPGGDPGCQEPPAPPSMESPIKVVSHLGGGGTGAGEARSSVFERMMATGAAAGKRPQTELLTKTPAQSRTSILYKFATDDILREQYRDPWNEVRISKLLEDLDALAGTIAVKHCSDEDSITRPLLVVTAPVDRMVLMKPLRIDTDVKIAGAVTYVGRSSIDIQIEVTQVDQNCLGNDM